MIDDELYDAAFEYKKRKLWKKLWDSQIFAVKHSDGEIGYCCVMGKNGEYMAIAVYPEISKIPGYYNRRNIDSEESMFKEIEGLEYALMQECVILSFLNKDMLKDEDLKMAKEYFKKNKITPRGKNAYPLFESCRYFQCPWYIEDEKEKTYLLDGILASIEVSEKLENKTPYDLGLYEGEFEDREIPLLEKTKNGYNWSSIKLPKKKKLVYPKGDFNKIAIPIKYKSVKRKGSEWVCHIFLNPEPIRDNDEAPHFPFIFIIADYETEQILGAAISKDAEAYEKEFTKYFVDIMIAEGKPRSVVVYGERTKDFFSLLAGQLGIQLRKEEYNDFLENFVYSYYSREDLDMENMRTNLVEIFSDPEAIKMFPDDMLKMLSDEIEEYDMFTPDIKEIVYNELRRRGLI